MTDGKPKLAPEPNAEPSFSVSDHTSVPPATYPDMLRLAAIATALDLSPKPALRAFEALADTGSGLATLAEASELIAVFLRLDPGERSKVLVEAKARALPRRSDE